MIRRTIATALLAALTLTTAACNEEKPEPIPETKSSPTESSSGPAWADKYTDEQLAAYRAALKTYRAFDREALPYLRDELIVRPKAEAVWLKYWTPRQRALVQFNKQMVFRDQGYRLKKAERELWARPKRVAEDLLQVTIHRCLDGPTAVITQNGQKLDVSGSKAFLSTVALVRTSTGTPWRLTQYQEFPERAC